MNSLRKYKKTELIDLLLEYETEINQLKMDLTSSRLDLEAKNDELMDKANDRANDSVVNKTIEYLVKRIRTINDKEKKLIYVMELQRINKSN